MQAGCESGVRRWKPAVLLLVLLAFLALQSCAGKRPPVPQPPPAQPPRVEILSSRIEANDAFIEIRFRLSGMGKADPNTSETYLVDDASGERFYTIRLQRVGKLDEVESGEYAHTVLFKNRDGLLHPGARVTLVVGSLRKELVLREK